MDAPDGRTTAVVTGGASGIGAAVARRLASDGLAVAVADVDVDRAGRVAEEIAAAGGRALPVAMDVSDEGSVARGLDQVTDRLGAVTVLVSNAGTNAPDVGIEDLTSEQWARVTGINLGGSFHLSRAVVPSMVAAGWGRIVTVASISALGDPWRADYASAKAGLIGLTRSLSLQLGRHGITSNAVAPGYVMTEMTRRSAQRRNVDFEEHQRVAADAIPVGRVGQPEDVAHAVAFFTAPEAGFVSGQVLYVAGGPPG